MENNDDRQDLYPEASSSMGDFEDRAFATLDKNVKEFLAEIQGETALDGFRKEYEMLYATIQKQHNFEKILHQQHQNLSIAIAKNKKTMKDVEKINEQHQITIAQLKNDIDKNWILVDDAQDKESNYNIKINSLKKEIDELNKVVESGQTEAMAEDVQLQDLEKEKMNVLKERDAQMHALQELKNVLNEWSDKNQAIELEKINLEHSTSLLQEEYIMKRKECDRETKRKEKLEKEMKSLHLEMENKQEEIKKKQALMQEAQHQIDKLELKLKEQRTLIDKAQRELDLVLQKVAKVSIELEVQLKTNTQLMFENSQRQSELKAKEEEIETCKDNISKINKVCNNTHNKLKQVEFAKEDLEKHKAHIIEEKVNIEKEIELQKKKTNHAQKRIDECARERDVLNKMKSQVKGVVEKQQDLMQINQVRIHNLEVELSKYQGYIKKQLETILKLEEECNQKNMELQAYGLKHINACEELLKCETNNVKIQKEILAWEPKIKHQQNLYKVIQIERNVNNKKYIEAHDEIGEMKRKFKVMNNLVENLKDEITSKDVAIIKEHENHQKIEKEREKLKEELCKVQWKIKSIDVVINDHNLQNDSLKHILEEGDLDVMHQKKELEIVQSEKRVLGAQLIHKNNELMEVYNKIRIQESSIHKGHIDYCNRLSELRQYKFKLHNLKREYTMLTGSCKNIVILRKEVHNLSQQLVQEKTKVKALSEELENPLNVHRWRKLEGTDPHSYELIIKIQLLQKKLTSKTEEVIEKDILIREKEKLYIELCKISASQPGIEVAKQVDVYKRKLQDKMKHLSYITSELARNQIQVDEYKTEIDTSMKELDVVKKQYFANKKAELACQPKKPVYQF
ncbi:uncharacterized protein [Physcomitrium patens]|nr:cilia- and flagella-associated protein 58-like [Physcomitrium patens]|eukprot:XP_024384770.1 cilia- and flagella-associated protein 58-like [Physcomitrella patens]